VGPFNPRRIYNLLQEAEFVDVIGTEVFGVFLLAIHIQLYQQILLPPPLEQNWFETEL
jgi:hypothetical protein